MIKGVKKRERMHWRMEEAQLELLGEEIHFPLVSEQQSAHCSVCCRQSDCC